MTNIKMPTTKDEQLAILNDPPKFQAILADSELTKQWDASRFAIAMKEGDFIPRDQMKEQLQITAAEMFGKDGKSPVAHADLDERGRPTLYGKDGQKLSTGHGAIYNKNSTGAKLETTWKPEERFDSIGEYCRAIWLDGAPGTKSQPDYKELTAKLNRNADIQNSFGSEVPGDGGFLIPEVMREDIMQLALEDAIVRPRAMVLPMSTLSLKIPAVDETSRVSSLSGGVTFSYTEEGSSITESQATFNRIELNARKLAGYFQVPNELLSDAPAFSAWFDSRIPAALAWNEDLNFIRGTGNGEPEGFLNSPAMVTVSAEAGQAVGSIVMENIASMYQRMFPESLSRAVWIADIAAFKNLATMGLVVGTGGGPVWQAGGYGMGAAAGPPATLYGRPIIFSEKVPAAGSIGSPGTAGAAGCLSFVDLSYYAIGDRQMAQIAASEHVAFQNDRTAFRILLRSDGRSWIRSALTPHNNGSTLSAFVQMPAQ